MNRCHCAALYERDHQAEAAFLALEEGRFNTDDISLLGQPGVEREAACGRPLWAGKTLFQRPDAAPRGLWSRVDEWAWVSVPTVGTIAVAGPVIAVLSELASRGAGCEALAEALVRIGVPLDTTLHYQAALCAGHFLLVMPGSRREVECCHALLAMLDAIDVSVHLQ